jgi:hypothetical protein
LQLARAARVAGEAFALVEYEAETPPRRRLPILVTSVACALVGLATVAAFYTV